MTGIAGGEPCGPPEPARVLAAAVAEAVDAADGYAGGAYLRSRTDGLLRLAALAGLPLSLFRPWRQLHMNRPFPVAEAFRDGTDIQLADSAETMRRFPQLAAGLPFPFGSLYAPVQSAGRTFGVLLVLREATPGRPVAPEHPRRLRGVAEQLGARLAEVEARGSAVTWDDEPLAVQLPAPWSAPTRIGRFLWDAGTDAVTVDDELCAILGLPPETSPGTLEDLVAGASPQEAGELLAAAREAAEADEPLTRRIRVRAADGRLHLLELSTDHGMQPPGHHVGGAWAGSGRQVAGLLVDLGAAAAADEAAGRFPEGVFSLDRLGRITYVSPSAEPMFGIPREQLLGRVLWQAVAWIAPHEEQFRAAMLAHEPVHFRAHRMKGADSEWFALAAFADRSGVSCKMFGTDRPPTVPDPDLPPPPAIGGDTETDDIRAAWAAVDPLRDLAGVARAIPVTALYRPVALAIALTEAVTARQVSAVVTEELLPAFGGRQLALYVLRERQLYLAWETGFPQGFLDQFDGVALDARLPGVETLTSGRPIFFESMGQLAAAYPGIPLDAHRGARAFLPLIASGRPVGSCILGFDQPRGFSPEERTVLTALAGLIAQALERAQRYDTEFALARGLQDALLPHGLPVLDRVETTGRYLPGTRGMDVGGDWYDVIRTCEGAALVIGDVQGHGVAAAATMGQLRSAVRAFTLIPHTPEEVMSGTNRLLIDLDPGQFASCCYVRLDASTGEVQAVRAGHPQPLLRHPDGRTEVLDLAGGVVLGVDPSAAYPVTRLCLEPGAVLALYTDGLVERPGTDFDVGVEQLRAMLSAADEQSLAGLADVSIVSSVFFMCLADKVLVYGD
ncbi:SpoIIE family protein phosphatase, partial [Streptomyces sp. NPDC002004]